MTPSALPPPSFDAAFRATLETLFRWRRDVRGFRPDPVPEALLEHLLALAELAPSVGLSQPWRIATVDDPARRTRIRENFTRANAAALACQTEDRAPLYATLKLAGLDAAPIHLAVFAEPDPAQGGGLGRATMPETTIHSAVMAIHTLWLAARAAGLGLGWVSILNPAEVTAALDVPADWHFIGYLCLGWPELESETPELARAGWEHRRNPAQAILRR
jgi:5,6-dimethylbenzimidazole synthase